MPPNGPPTLGGSRGPLVPTEFLSCGTGERYLVSDLHNANNSCFGSAIGGNYSNDPRRKSLMDQYKRSQEIKSLQAQVKAKDEKIVSLTNTVARMEDKMKEVEGFISQLTTSEESSSSLNKEYEEEIKKLQAEIGSIKSTETSLRTELQQKTTKLELARKNNELVSPNMQRYLRTVHANSVKHSKKDEDLRYLLEAGNADTKNRAMPLPSRVQREEIAALKKKLQDAETKNTKDISTLSSLRGEVASLKQTLARTEAKQQDEKSTLQGELATLKRRLAETATRSSDEKSNLQEEIVCLQMKLNDIEAKQLDDRVGEVTRYKTMEQKYLNKINILKTRLTEFEVKWKEENYRVGEERKIGRTKEAQRLLTLDKLRKEKEGLENQTMALEDTIIELRTKLAAQSISNRSGNILLTRLTTATPSNSVRKGTSSSGVGGYVDYSGATAGARVGEYKTDDEEEKKEEEATASSSQNLARLRNQLNISRARLSAARGQHYLKQRFSASPASSVVVEDGREDCHSYSRVAAEIDGICDHAETVVEQNQLLQHQNQMYPPQQQEKPKLLKHHPNRYQFYTSSFER